jgi:2-methylcitrate dehydratase PrpD
MPALAKSSPQVTHTLAEELSQFALQLSYHAIPATVRERAKHLILDSVGIALASTKYPFASISLSALEELGTGNSPVIGIGRRLALRDAVLMNGILIHGLDFDDTHSRGVIHATASSFPCALALTDRAEADGRTLLSAYVAAMEVATRLGSVAKGGFHQVGFHPTGLIGAFGCTLAAARILGLDPDRATMAQGIVLSMASGSLEFLEDGAWTKRMHPGWAGVAGITAATLAKHGFVGPRAAYDGRFGLYASHLGNHFEKADLGLATENLGRSWQIDEVAVKPIPACHFTHAAADAAIALHAAYGLSNKDIRRVRALVPQEVVKTVCEPVANKRNPANSYDAQFSIPYIVATGLLKGRFTLAELEDEALHDSAVLSLASRVEYEVDPASTFPRHYTGEVIVDTEDGRCLRHREAINRGCADRPLTNDEVVAKFIDNAERAVSRDTAERIRNAVLDLDRQNACTLADALCAKA